MSKYNITINTISTESLPFTASGQIGDQQFELQTIIYNGGPIWKTKEHGMVPCPTSMSEFSRGQRSAIAAWAKKVEQDPALVGQSSQIASATGTATPRRNAINQQMQQELEQLRALVAQLTGDRLEDSDADLVDPLDDEESFEEDSAE